MPGRIKPNKSKRKTDPVPKVGCWVLVRFSDGLPLSGVLVEETSQNLFRCYFPQHKTLSMVGRGQISRVGPLLWELDWAAWK